MIRSMEVRDAQAVYSIFTESLGYTCELDVVRKRIGELAERTDHRCLVWADDNTGEVRAFIHAQRYETLHDDIGGWNVIALAVTPSAQNQGIGRELLTHFERMAAEDGAAFVRLNSRVERIEAHGFYEHVGYDNNKTQKHFVKHFKMR